MRIKVRVTDAQGASFAYVFQRGADSKYHRGKIQSDAEARNEAERFADFWARHKFAVTVEELPEAYCVACHRLI